MRIDPLIHLSEAIQAAFQAASVPIVLILSAALVVAAAAEVRERVRTARRARTGPAATVTR